MGCFFLPLPQVTNALLGVVPLARNKTTDKTTTREAFRMECQNKLPQVTSALLGAVPKGT